MKTFECHKKMKLFNLGCMTPLCGYDIISHLNFVSGILGGGFGRGSQTITQPHRHSLPHSLPPLAQARYANLPHAHARRARRRPYRRSLRCSIRSGHPSAPLLPAFAPVSSSCVLGPSLALSPALLVRLMLVGFRGPGVIPVRPAPHGSRPCLCHSAALLVPRPSS
jgi:hypothetical protein